MADIRIDAGFPTHPKTRQLRKIGGGDAIDALLALWCYAGAYKENGILSNMDDYDIAFAAEYAGDYERFVAMLIEVGFIDDTTPRKLHNWKKRQPYVVKAASRRKQARKAAAIRWDKKTNKECPQHTDQHSGQHTDQQATSNAPLPLPPPLPPPAPSPDPNTETPVFSKPKAETKPIFSPIQESFIEWESAEFEMTVLPRMASFYGGLPQLRELPGWRSGVDFVRDYKDELRSKVMTNPEYFNAEPIWKDKLARFIKTGIESGRVGNAGMKAISAAEEKSLEDEKRVDRKQTSGF